MYACRRLEFVCHGSSATPNSPARRSLCGRWSTITPSKSMPKRRGIMLFKNIMGRKNPRGARVSGSREPALEGVEHRGEDGGEDLFRRPVRSVVPEHAGILRAAEPVPDRLVRVPHHLQGGR